MTLALDLLLFVAVGALLVWVAVRLALEGDSIARESGLGSVWIGTVLMAGATSLPELVTDVTAVRLESPDLAAGDLFGSTLANMVILAIIDLVSSKRRVLVTVALDHVLAATLALVMTGVAASLILTRAGATWMGIHPGSWLLVAIYIAGSRAIYRHGRRAAGAAGEAAPEHRVPWRPLGRFALAASGVLVLAPAFAWSAKRIAEGTGLGGTFVGTTLVGISTSIPELVASLAAVRIGALDLAVGNLFGSNAFNMVVFPALDAASPGPSIFATLSTGHVLSAILGMILMSLGAAAMVYRAERRLALAEPSSALIVVAYAISLWLLYTHVVP